MLMLNYLFIFLVSLFVSFLVFFVIKKLFYKLKILDNPLKYWKTRAPVPYSMWVVFFISFLILSYFFVDHNYKLYLIWWFGLLITIISFIDDMLNLSPKIRLLIQIIIGLTIWVSAIKIWYVSNIFWWIIDLDSYYLQIFQYKIFIVSLLFTVIWYVFIFNAINLTDWIPGNTSGLSIINFLILFLLWYILFKNDNWDLLQMNSKFIMSMSIILVWIIIPFWLYDVKEKVLMWDSWTMFLAFMLASLSIISGWKIATVLIVFWIYAVDAIYVILRRLYNKKSPLKWDFTHLHHRLLDLWMTKNQVLIFVYSFSFLFWLIGLFLNKLWKIIIFVFIVFFVIFINRIIHKFKNYEKK